MRIRASEHLCEYSRLPIKKLRKVWKLYRHTFTKERILILDNTPTTYADNYGNALVISTFTNGADDRELLTVLEKLKHLRLAENVRLVDKIKLLAEYS